LISNEIVLQRYDHFFNPQNFSAKKYYLSSKKNRINQICQRTLFCTSLRAACGEAIQILFWFASSLTLLAMTNIAIGGELDAKEVNMPHWVAAGDSFCRCLG